MLYRRTPPPQETMLVLGLLQPYQAPPAPSPHLQQMVLVGSWLVYRHNKHKRKHHGHAPLPSVQTFPANEDAAAEAISTVKQTVGKQGQQAFQRLTWLRLQ